MNAPMGSGYAPMGAPMGMGGAPMGGMGMGMGMGTAPMGGMGQSGLGRRHGIEGLLRFTQPQTIARQRWISIGPKFGLNDERWTQLLSISLMILKRLRIR